MAHTPIPWKHHQTSSGYAEIWGQSTKDGHVPVILCSADSDMYNPLPNEDTGNNFKFICKAVNSHQVLIDALEDIQHLHMRDSEGLSSGVPSVKEWEDVLDKIHAAIKLVKGE